VPTANVLYGFLGNAGEAGHYDDLQQVSVHLLALPAKIRRRLDRACHRFAYCTAHAWAGAVIAIAVSTPCRSCPVGAKPPAATIDALPNIGKFPLIMEFGPVFDLKAIGKSGAAQ
jgi:hypothetical protein